MVVLACALVGQAGSAGAHSSDGRLVCPKAGIIDMTVRGGVIVKGNVFCQIRHSTVRGGIVITRGSDIDLESSRVTGGIWVRAGGEVEIGTDLFAGTKTVSRVHGGLHLTRPIDWDIESARISGGVAIRGGVSPEASPTFCGNTVWGGVRVRGTTFATSSWIGDPTEPLTDTFGPCRGNRIHGTLRLVRTTGFEVEGNHVTGSVALRASTLELNGNRITGSLLCQAHTRLTHREDPSDPRGNRVGGRNTCII